MDHHDHGRNIWGLFHTDIHQNDPNRNVHGNHANGDVWSRGQMDNFGNSVSNRSSSFGGDTGGFWGNSDSNKNNGY